SDWARSATPTAHQCQPIAAEPRSAMTAAGTISGTKSVVRVERMPRVEDEMKSRIERRSRPSARPPIRDGCVRGRDAFRRTVIGDRAYTVEFATTVRRSSAVEQAAHGQGQPLGETQGCNWVNCRET